MEKVNSLCSKCTACINSCPTGAITLKDDGLFKKTVIDEKKCTKCGLCKKICPYNREYTTNTVKYYVGRVSLKSNIKKSSSGGIFGQLARVFLNEGSIVYGAAFTEKFAVEHIRIDNINDLEKILKSKYVLSNLNNIFQKVKEDLINNKKVLFSGTPCQIAGLKSYLQKDYQNLYTIDIVCHGCSSPVIWKKYKEELEKQYNSKMVAVDFRYFSEKDPTKNFYVKFANGKTYREVLYKDSYGKAFLTNMIFDDNCYSCKFCGFKNVSDITLGDAHGYKNEEYQYKNSLIIVNNSKGEKLFNKIKDSLILFDDYSVESLVLNNYPIMHPPIKHYNSGKVNINAKSISQELTNKCDNIVFDCEKNAVGILNFHYENYNYGANLVAYSLSEVAKKCGYTPVVIDFDPFADLDPITRARTFKLYEFRQKYLNMTPRYRDKDELFQLNKCLDRFIVGSDQVWRKVITQTNLKTYFLDFVNDDKIKIAYAASFGKGEFEGNEEETIECSELLNEFDAISVRENDGVDVCRNYFNVNATVTLDPTLLLTSAEYEKIIDEEYEKLDVAVYFVMDHENKITEDDNFKRLFKNKKIENIKGYYEESPTSKQFIFNSISKWLDGIRKCEYLVTDSFHGVVFGIIFRKKIICIGKNSAALSRFESLFTNLQGGLEKINYSTLSEVDNIDYTPNYDEINENLKKLQKASIDFLKNGLNNKKKRKSIYTNNLRKILNNYQKYKQEVEQLKIEADNLKVQIDNLQIENERQKLILNDNENYINNLNQTLTQISQNYNDVVNSKSWRYTRILRSIVRRLKVRK